MTFLGRHILIWISPSWSSINHIQRIVQNRQKILIEYQRATTTERDDQRSGTGLQLNCDERSMQWLIDYLPKVSQFFIPSGYRTSEFRLVNICKVSLLELPINYGPLMVFQLMTRTVRTTVDSERNTGAAAARSKKEWSNESDWDRRWRETCMRCCSTRWANRRADVHYTVRKWVQNWSNSADDIETMAWSESKGLAGEEVNIMNAQSTEGKFKGQIEKTRVELPQLGNNATPSEVETATAQLLEAIMINLFSRGTADDANLECLKGCLKPSTFKNAIEKRIVSSPLFIRPVVGFIKQHVELTIDNCWFTPL